MLQDPSDFYEYAHCMMMILLYTYRHTYIVCWLGVGGVEKIVATITKLVNWMINIYISLDTEASLSVLLRLPSGPLTNNHQLEPVSVLPAATPEAFVRYGQ